MSNQPCPMQEAMIDLLQSNDPRIHATILADEFKMFELGLATLYILAPDGSEKMADQYAVNFVTKSLENSAYTMRGHLKALRRTLGMPDEAQS